jgi:hypothetical protein
MRKQSIDPVTEVFVTTIDANPNTFWESEARVHGYPYSIQPTNFHFYA